MSNLSDADIERIAAILADKLGHTASPDHTAAIVHKIVQEMTVKGLAFVGVDVADKTQIEALKADLSFVRSLRERCERVGKSMTSAIATAVTYGILGLLILGFMWWARGSAPPHTSPPPNFPRQ